MSNFADQCSILRQGKKVNPETHTITSSELFIFKVALHVNKQQTSTIAHAIYKKWTKKKDEENVKIYVAIMSKKVSDIKCPYHQNCYFPIWSYNSCTEHLRKKFSIWTKSDFVMNVFKHLKKPENPIFLRATRAADHSIDMLRVVT